VLHVLREHGIVKAIQAYELVSLHIAKTSIKEVSKRGAGNESFHPQKLFKSIKKSFSGAGIPSGKLAEELTKKTIEILETKYGNSPVPSKAIKRTVARFLAERGFKQVERMYVLHKYF
ncbi:MAG: ATP cone domain-containing protein, partial [Patescibacteria group bacterium]